uniref:Thioredoxin domain-containing protein n=1 Tax=Rhabditophanes sp. KR3021 TaxID=114890 RepID=A0AC35U0R9_9BILA
MRFYLILALLFEAINCYQHPHSAVLELNDKFLEIKDEGFWFVAFTAPWCSWCKRLLPLWEHLAHGLADKDSAVRVGKIDCTRFTNVASKLKIQGFPTLIFFRNGVEIPYNGERTTEKMVDFAVKTAGPVINQIQSQKLFYEATKTSVKDPMFIYVGEKNHLYDEYDSIANSQFTSTRFYLIDSLDVLPKIGVLSTDLPTVIVFKDNAQYVFPNDGCTLTDWILKEKWPVYPQLTHANINTISESTRKFIVLAVSDLIDRTNLSHPVGIFDKMVGKTASLIRKDSELSSMFQFGWFDGNVLATSIVIGAFEKPGLIVFNYTTYEYYLSQDLPEQMTENSIKTFLGNIIEGEVQPMGGKTLYISFKRYIFEMSKGFFDMVTNQPILTTILFGVPSAFFAIIAYSVCSSDFSVDRNEIYADSDEEDYGNDSGTEESDIDNEIVRLEDNDHEKEE